MALYHRRPVPFATRETASGCGRSAITDSGRCPPYVQAKEQTSPEEATMNTTIQLTPRIDFPKVDPESFQALLALQARVDASGIEPGLLHLVKLRASQINGCAYCIDMHSKDARAAGETEQRLYGLDAWAEAPYYDARERAS
jgi:AhpD family alkylhydroperoxidase